MKHQIALIGIGNIGMRHFQSLITMSGIEIHVVELDEDAVAKVENQFKNNIVPKVTYNKNIASLPDVLDITIIATSSDVRRKVVEEFYDSSKITRHMILEKVLFQELRDYQIVEELLKKNNTKGWVNCVRRTWSVYKDIKAIFANEDAIDFHVLGSNLDLGCNGIHFLDIFSYISGDYEYKLYHHKLEKKAVESKRKNFYRVDGLLEGSLGGKHSAMLYSVTQTARFPLSLQIVSDNVRCVIDEANCQYMINKNSKCEVKSFEKLFVSQVTKEIVKDLLAFNTCELTRFADSIKIHQTFIEVINDHFTEILGSEVKRCPIT